MIYFMFEMGDSRRQSFEFLSSILNLIGVCLLEKKRQFFLSVPFLILTNFSKISKKCHW